MEPSRDCTVDGSFAESHIRQLQLELSLPCDSEHLLQNYLVV